MKEARKGLASDTEQYRLKWNLEKDKTEDLYSHENDRIAVGNRQWNQRKWKSTE